MTDEERIAAASSRYHRAAHAMQSGVAWEVENRALSDADTAKHLRVGINAAMGEHAGLATLLISKGLFTKAEYMEAMAQAMEDEVARYEKIVSKATGAKVKLG